MPAGFYEPTNNATTPKRFILYGPPKTVKTPLALAYGAYLRKLNPKAKTLYIAADRGSEDLPSLPDPSWREWIKVWKVGSPLEPGYDPYKEAIHIAMTDWKKVDPDIELIVWDTMSEECDRILQFIADKEFFSGHAGGSKHITFGDPLLPKGSAARLNIPMPGDYNGINGIAKRLFEMILSQNLHILILAWEEDIKDKDGIKRVGPAFVGKALTAKLPGKLTGIIYTDKRGEPDNKGKLIPTLYVCSDPADDMHMAGVRHEPVNGDPRNPIPRVKVTADLVAYWKLFFETLFPQEQTQTTGVK